MWYVYNSIQFLNSFCCLPFQRANSFRWERIKNDGEHDDDVESHWNHLKWNIIHEPVSLSNFHSDASCYSDLYVLYNTCYEWLFPSFRLVLQFILDGFCVLSCLRWQISLRWMPFYWNKNLQMLVSGNNPTLNNSTCNFLTQPAECFWKFSFLFVWMSVFLVETIITFSIPPAPHLCLPKRRGMGFARHQGLNKQAHDWTTFCSNRTSLCHVLRFASLIRLFACSFCVSVLFHMYATTVRHSIIQPQANNLICQLLHLSLVFSLVLAGSVLVVQEIYCRKTFIIIQLRYWFFCEIRKRSCVQNFVNC